MSGIDTINNLKIKLFKSPKLELINKPNMMKIEDLLNKEDSNNGNPKLKGELSENSSIIKQKGKDNVNARPSTSGSIGSASVMSHDSTISNAHISILESTKQMVRSAELFTKQ